MPLPSTIADGERETSWVLAARLVPWAVAIPLLATLLIVGGATSSATASYWPLTGPSP
jgi:hypothetical protein